MSDAEIRFVAPGELDAGADDRPWWPSHEEIAAWWRKREGNPSRALNARRRAAWYAMTWDSWKVPVQVINGIRYKKAPGGGTFSRDGKRPEDSNR